MAKIDKAAITFTAELITKGIGAPLSISRDYYIERKLSAARFIWDLHRFANGLIKEAGFSCLFAGKEDKTSWAKDAKFLYEGEINDSHIMTAMRAVIAELGVNVADFPTPAVC